MAGEIMESAPFGAGCFWAVESLFQEVLGVTDAVGGGAGRTKDSPKYRDVCCGDTAHAEVVQGAYDIAQVNYDRLLDVFFANHDPTTLRRAGYSPSI
jgi:peptide-methionine (S)-S-oxide reductase